jgi:hypothetical protein
MFYTFYKTINLINTKHYYGAHKTCDLDDGYLGSGKAIKAAIKKYGKENFKKEILHHFNCEFDMYSYEKYFIDESVVNDKMTYNETLGGRGGFSHIDLSGDKNPMKRKDVVDKVVKKNRENGVYTSSKRINHLKKIGKIANKINTGKIRPEHSKFMSDYAKNITWKDKDKMRDALSSFFLVISPIGKVEKTNRLQDFCKVNNLPYTTIWKSSIGNNIIKKGKAKGWICKKV